MELSRRGGPSSDGIGYAIQQHAERSHFSVVRELVEQGSAELHGPQVELRQEGRGLPLAQGMTLAIEPWSIRGLTHRRSMTTGRFSRRTVRCLPTSSTRLRLESLEPMYYSGIEMRRRRRVNTDGKRAGHQVEEGDGTLPNAVFRVEIPNGIQFWRTFRERSDEPSRSCLGTGCWWSCLHDLTRDGFSGAQVERVFLRRGAEARQFWPALSR